MSFLEASCPFWEGDFQEQKLNSDSTKFMVFLDSKTLMFWDWPDLQRQCSATSGMVVDLPISFMHNCRDARSRCVNPISQWLTLDDIKVYVNQGWVGEEH